MTLDQKVALRDFLEGQSPLREAIEMFVALQAQHYHAEASRFMRRVPRQAEEAADAAARADAYETWMSELHFFSDNQQ